MRPVTRTAYSANPGMTSSIAVPLFEGETLHGALALVFFAKALTLTEAIDRFLSPLQRTAKIINDELVAKG